MPKFEMRLRKLERVGGEYGDIIRLIRQGAYYDALSKQEQRRYCLYRYGFEYCPEEYLFSEMIGNPFNRHFKLELKPPPPTAEEMRERITEVEEMVKSCKTENI